MPLADSVDFSRLVERCGRVRCEFLNRVGLPRWPVERFGWSGWIEAGVRVGRELKETLLALTASCLCLFSLLSVDVDVPDYWLRLRG